MYLFQTYSGIISDSKGIQPKVAPESTNIGVVVDDDALNMELCRSDGSDFLISEILIAGEGDTSKA